MYFKVPLPLRRFSDFTCHMTNKDGFSSRK